MQQRRRSPNLQNMICARIDEVLKRAPVQDPWGYEALAYLKMPGPNYQMLLQALHKSLEPKLYVEIGVRTGDTLRLALPETRCVAIDPLPQIEPRPNTLLGVCTSDDFFAIEANRDKARGFDLALIDGDHSYEQARRDFENLEALATPWSIICVHDVIPMDERTSTPKPEHGGFWTGDVWRLIETLLLHRQDLTVFTVACPPTGLAIIGHFSDLLKGAGTDAWDPDGAAKYEYPARWEDQIMRLNIVPNNPASILKALARR